VLGLDLPGGGGLRVHERIRRSGEPAVPVVYVAPANAGPLRQEALALGAAALLDLPVAPGEVVAVVGDLLGRRGRRPAQRTGGSLRVLVVESDPDRCSIIQRGLGARGREHVEVTVAPTVRESCQLLQRSRYACVLLSHRLPDGAGIDLLDEAEESLLTTPVIGIPADDDAETCLRMFRAGCAEVLSRQQVLSTDTLRRDVAAALARFQRRAMATVIERRQLGDAIVRSQEGLISLARTDQLLGICNRSVFDDLHPRIHDRAAREGARYGLCMVDVDNFKAYNDAFGHAAGDEALRRVADALAATLRGDDFIARYGGEEMVILLEDVSEETLADVTERLRVAVAACGIAHPGNDPHGVMTASIGAAMLGAGATASPAALLLSADQAMYRAKHLGRNRVVTSILRARLARGA
jgi:diguanylate cyclase (GGDEF)-like protein